MNMPQDKLITIVISTYNRAKLLEACLESLLTQTIAPELYDVYVINNNCTDNTSEVVAKFSKAQSNIKEIFESEVGLSAARNRGYKESNTAYIAYLDDDAKLSNNWVEVAIKVVKDVKPDIFGGPVYPYYEGEKVAWYDDKYGFYSVYDFQGEVTKNDEIFLSGSNVIFSRETLDQYGGFNTSYGMKGKLTGYHEETAIQIQAKEDKKHIFYEKTLVVYHVVAKVKQNILFNMYASYKSGKDGVAVWNHKYEFKDLVQLVGHLDYVFSELKSAMIERDQEKYPYPENYVMDKLKPAFEEIGRRVEYFSKPESINTQEVISYLRKDRKKSFAAVLGASKNVYSDGLSFRYIWQLVKHIFSHFHPRRLFGRFKRTLSKKN